MIRFRCPHCGKAIGAPARSGGKRGSCPECGRPIKVPLAVVEPQRDLSQEPAAEFPQVEFDPDAMRDLAGRFGWSRSRLFANPYSTYNFGVASLLLGGLSFISCWLPFFSHLLGGLGAACGLLGVSVGLIRRQARTGLAAVGLALSLTSVIAGSVVLAGLTGSAERFSQAASRVQIEDLIPTLPGRLELDPERLADAGQANSSQRDSGWPPVTSGVFDASAGARAGFDPQAETARVHEDLRTFIETTMVARDTDLAMEMMHPRAVELYAGGDRARVRKSIERAFSALARLDARFEDASFPSPPVFVHSRESDFALVPTSIVAVYQGRRIESVSFQLGEKPHDSDRWRYLEGERLTHDKIRVIFPDFPDGVSLPPVYKQPL